MGFDKCKTVRVLQRNEVLFCSRINPIEFLPYLPWMSEMSKEEITCEQKNYGAKRAASLLLKQIRRQDKCLIDFVRALRFSDMPHEDLADLLDPEHFLVDTGQHTESHNPVLKACTSTSDTTIPVISSHGEPGTSILYSRVPVMRTLGNYDGHTPLQQLPCQVMTILQNKLDYDDNWKDLAAYREYTIAEVQRLQSSSKSCTVQIISEWYLATVDDLFKALHAIERFDIITDIEKQIGYKSLVYTEDPFIDLKKIKHKGQNRVVEQASNQKFVTDSGSHNENPGATCTTLEQSAPNQEQSIQFVDNSCVLSQKDSNQLVPQIGDLGRSFRQEPVSVENNMLQAVHDGNNEIEEDSLVLKIRLKQDDEENSIINEKNNNTKFVEKKMCDKMMDTTNICENRLLIGAGVGVIGAMALGFLALRNS